MKPIAAVLFALLLGSAAALAQSSVPQKFQSTLVRPAPAGVACPVDMQAQQQVRGDATQRISPGANRHKDDRSLQPAQSLRLTLKNATFQKIVGVRLTIHGLNAKGRVSQAQMVRDASQIAKTMELKVAVDPKSETPANLWLPGFTSVSQIDLDLVHYGDGTVWRASVLRACHFVPDAIMLIGSR